MNKQEASRQAFDNKRTVAELRAMIASRRGVSGRSRINPDLTVTQLLDIFAGALVGRLDNEVPRGNHYPNRGITRDGLLIRNILRECA